MPQRINGGVFNDQVLTGSLKHFSISGADFSGAVDQYNKPVHNSAAEIIYTLIAQKATIVIMDPISNADGMSFALETGRADWNAERLQEAIRSLGTIGVDNVDVSAVEVEAEPYDLLGTTGGASSFLELIDTPFEYAGSSGYNVVVNATEDGLIFVPGTGGGGNVLSVFGREGNVVAEAGDYTSTQVTNESTVTGPTVTAALDNLNLISNTALQPGDNVSELTNDAGYITLSEVPADAVTSVDGRTGIVTLDDLYAPIVHTHVKADITDFNEADYATAAQGALADSAIQPGDNVSELVNDTGFITALVDDKTPFLGGDLYTDGFNIIVKDAGLGNDGIAFTDELLEPKALISYDTAENEFELASTVDMRFSAGNDDFIFSTTGNFVVHEIVYPANDGTINQALLTDGDGNLAFATVVNSFNGRTGIITPEANDYSINQLSDVDLAGIQTNDILKWNGTAFVPSSDLVGVDTFNGRSGAVVPLAGDYDTDQITNVSTATGATLSESLDDHEARIVDVESRASDLESVKADKVIGAVENNFAGLDVNGNLIDSGNKASDFAPIVHTHVEADITDLDKYTQAEVDAKDAALQENIDGKSDIGHTHVKADITDFNEADYATAAQGALADSAIQPGDNVSELVNDAGYITLGEVPTDIVTTVHGRTGDITSENLDYFYHQTSAEPIATGLVTGGELTLNGSNVDVASGRGYIVDAVVYDQPDFVIVDFVAGSVAYDPTLGVTSWIYVDFNGVIQSQNTRPTTAETKQNIYLGFVVANASGNTITESYDYVGATSSDVNELMRINSGVIDGGLINLGLDKDFGLTDITVYSANINRRTNPFDPNVKTYPGGNPLTFTYMTQTGLIVGDPVQLVDPETFNPTGDDLVRVEDNGSETTIQYLYLLRDGTYIMQYGQFEYSSSTSGRRALETDMATRAIPSILDGAFLLYAFIMEEDADVMTDTGDIYVVNLFNVINDAPAVSTVFDRVGDISAEAGDYEDFYATIAQGALADTALQPGLVDNVSELVNDAGYLTTATVPHQFSEANPTGLADGGELNIIGGTDIEVIAGTGIIVDSYTNPLIPPVVTQVSWETTQQAITTPATPGAFAFFTIDSTGTLKEYSARPSEATRRDEIMLGLAIFNGTTWGEVSSPTVANNTAHTLEDYLNTVGGPTFTINGGAVSEAPSFGLDREAGTVWEQNRNWHVDKKNPHRESFDAITGLTWRYVNYDFTNVSASTNIVDPATYDDVTGSGVGTVPGNNSTATIQRLFIDPRDNFWVLYGQNVYTNFEEAVARIGVDTASTEIPALLSSGSQLLGYIVSEKSQTDWGPDDARFVSISAAGGGGGNAGVTSFLDLTDVEPTTYVGQANNAVTVSPAEGGVEFTDLDAKYANITHATTHEVGGTDLINHDNLTNAQGFKSHATIDTEITDIQTNAVFDGDRLLGGTF